MTESQEAILKHLRRLMESAERGELKSLVAVAEMDGDVIDTTRAGTINVQRMALVLIEQVDFFTSTMVDVQMLNSQPKH